jgi:hypothetical protein
MVVFKVVTNVSGEPAASVLRVEDQAAVSETRQNVSCTAKAGLPPQMQNGAVSAPEIA